MLSTSALRYEQERREVDFRGLTTETPEPLAPRLFCSHLHLQRDRWGNGLYNPRVTVHRETRCFARLFPHLSPCIKQSSKFVTVFLIEISSVVSKEGTKYPVRNASKDKLLRLLRNKKSRQGYLSGIVEAILKFTQWERCQLTIIFFVLKDILCDVSNPIFYHWPIQWV